VVGIASGRDHYAVRHGVRWTRPWSRTGSGQAAARPCQSRPAVPKRL